MEEPADSLLELGTLQGRLGTLVAEEVLRCKSVGRLASQGRLFRPMAWRGFDCKSRGQMIRLDREYRGWMIGLDCKYRLDDQLY